MMLAKLLLLLALSGFMAVSALYEDQMAQSVCTSLAHTGWVYAVRRPCPCARDCNAICQNAALRRQDVHVANRSPHCIESLKVYTGRPPLSAPEKLGPKIYRYGSCSYAGCGPNYCCCNFI